MRWKARRGSAKKISIPSECRADKAMYITGQRSWRSAQQKTDRRTKFGGKVSGAGRQRTRMNGRVCACAGWITGYMVRGATNRRGAIVNAAWETDVVC